MPDGLLNTIDPVGHSHYSLFRVWPVYGHVYLYQYVYLVQNLIIPCFLVRMYTEATCSAVKKLVGSLLKNEGDYTENSRPRFDQSHYRI